MNAKTKPKPKLTFAQLPRDYIALCGILTPRPIHDAADYANVTEVTDAMVLHTAEFSADQSDYFDVLCTLIEAYDAQHVNWGKRRTPLQILKFLLEEHSLNGAALSRILGAASRHLGPMILRGEREITADHARALGKHFALPPGTFIA